MKNIQYIKEPGYTYNLFYLFSLYYNKAYFKQEPFGYQYAAEDSKYFHDVLSKEGYMPFRDELLLFFYRKENNISFITQHYFLSCQDKFLTADYSFDAVLQELSDHKQVINNVLTFYFPELTSEAIAELIESPLQTGKLINASNYNETVKNSLYFFILDPKSLIQCLIDELKNKEQILSKKYSFSEIPKRFQNSDIESFLDTLKMIESQEINLDNTKNIYISFGPNLRRIIFYQHFDDALVIILGTDYLRYSEFLANQNDPFDLETFSNALTEKSRILLLDYIKQKKEVTIKDIERDLSLHNMKAYYHLALLTKGKLVKTRNKGRTILYSLNEDCFKKVINIFNTYIDTKEE